MIYMAEVVTPKSTLENNPLRSVLKATKGLVYKFHFYIPPGAMGLHHFQVYYGSYQVWPTTPGRSFHGDGIIVDFDDVYYVLTEPYEFVVLSWNLDTDNEHTVLISVGLVSEEAFMMRYLPGLTYEKMLEVLNRMTAQQEAQRLAVLAQPLPWLPAPQITAGGG